MSWISERKTKWNSLSCTSPLTSSLASALTRCDSNTMSDKESPRGSPEPNLDGFIQHCFKRYKLKERYPSFYLKLKPSRFGPPAPRRRILIAPPMQGTSLPSAKPQAPEPLSQKQETFTSEEHLKEVPKAPTEEDEVRKLDAWIEERKKLQYQLSKCADVESWLMGKESISEQEASVLRKIKESREVKKVQMKALSAPVSNTEKLLPRRKAKTFIPLINAPYPESLITLQNLLHKQKLKLVDIFAKEDRAKTMKFKRADFIRVIEGTMVPISKNDLEDVVIYLTSSKKGNYITHDDLAECQKIWMDYLRDQWKHAKEAKPGGRENTKELPPADQKVGPMVPKSAASYRYKFKILPPEEPKLDYLEVPSINTEPDRMHLTYNKMEEVGKRYREMRRRRKRKISLLEWAENCRVVKSGDPVVDNHCMPSTIEGDMGELVDKHRMASHLVWFQCVRLCQQYGIPLTERLLQRALLFPGDKLLNYGGKVHKIRQPGGHYEIYAQQESKSGLQEKPKSPPRKKEREKEVKPKKRQPEEKPLWGRWRSYAEFRDLVSGHSKRLRLAARSLWDESSFDSQSQMKFEKRFIEREMRRMFGFLNPRTDANSFWPGHLLDKLRLYLPEMERDEGEALFNHISRTRPVYSGIFHPYHNWPINELNYVTYGDPDSRKDYYYI
ncbi:EF-hand calcium-binding domain-containing protein 12 [Eublepharis macularius]|uniref:EF-hand calcium-binding domain-containing protein 12 n=1 Tax=Eublepharis macularius TaxID=481883 RepID=A0AA97J682_EUBMA|nr:EF-hand calcium-binding domain-containing protein 12 [Eublepharis macularius]